MDDKAAGIRKEYTQKALVESAMETDPMRQFSIWWHEALRANIIEVNAMTLATASADGNWWRARPGWTRRWNAAT